MGAIRRDLGQLILSTAILDDTIAWVLVAVIAGIAARGEVSLAGVGMTLLGVAVFLGLSVTFGRRIVAQVIRWSNDTLQIELPVMTAILLVMLAMALTTDLIGVHPELGAFVAGMLVGQSPILTEQIESQLRGFIVAFFSPIFFAVAGLGMDLTTLAHPSLLLVTLAMIVVASVGKFAGALAGGRIGGLTRLESLALATGLNARGSTEVIIASVGLSMGALNNELYTMIVAMAVVTTMIMPPSLRWVLARVPMREDEARRLEKEEAEADESVPKMERALVYVDGSANGRLAATLAGLFAAGQQVLTTVMAHKGGAADKDAETTAHDCLTSAAKSATDTVFTDPQQPGMQLRDLVQTRHIASDNAVEKEAGKGYSITFAGTDQPILPNATRFGVQLKRLVDSFHGPIAITVNGNRFAPGMPAPLNILVPTRGTPEARLAIEIALSLAKASGGTLTVLHVFDPQEDLYLLRGRTRRQGMSFLVDARRLGKRSGVPVKGLTATNARPVTEILEAARTGNYDLVVLGTTMQRGDIKFIGPHATALVRTLQAPVLFIAC